jgi:hypothetical protein
MEHVPAGGDLTDPTTDDVLDRRRRMRTQARGLRDGIGAPPRRRYETPAWLDHSFVLPLTEPDLTDVPRQPTPHHDDDEVTSPAVEPAEAVRAPAFERPPTPEIDFARVIRRSHLRRTATRTSVAATGLAGLVLIAYLLTLQPVVLAMAIFCALGAIAAGAVSVRLAFAPVPHL